MSETRGSEVERGTEEAGAPGRRSSQVLAGRPVAQAALVAAVLFVIYALGACRTIYVGDSGELVAAVHTLGIPHPSGYPLYVLLGKLWTLLLPVGSIAFRMSLFSAATAAAACGVLYHLSRRLFVGVPGALFGTALLAFAPSFWSQANVQRVYSLNALCLVLSISLACAWYYRRKTAPLLGSFFVAALGATNHTYMAVYGVGLVLFVLVTEPELLRRPKRLFACAAVGLSGFLPYLYMPLRSRADPRLDWGNPETWDGLVAAVTRREAWVRAWIEGPADLWVIAGDYLRGLGEETLWVGAALAVWGLATAIKLRWPVLLLAAAMVANFASMAAHGSRTDLFFWHRYYIPSFLIVALLAGEGLETVRSSWRRIAYFVAVVVPLALFVTGYPRFDRSRFRVADDFSRTLMATLPPGAHLAASDDNILFVLIYLHLVEGVRPDVDLILQGVGGADLPPLRFDPARDPLYFTHHPNWNIAGLDVVPVGLTFRTAPSGLPPPEPVVPKLRLEGEDDPRVPKDYLTQNLIGHFHYMLGVTYETRDWLRAEEEFAKARAAAPENDVLFYNLGLIYRRNGLYDRALASFERSHGINPRHIATNREVRASTRIEETTREIERLSALETRLLADPAPEGPPPGSSSYHHELAAALAAAGETRAARGHRLRALEAG